MQLTAQLGENGPAFIFDRVEIIKPKNIVRLYSGDKMIYERINTDKAVKVVLETKE